MTPQHIELVKATVPVLRENGVALTRYFYQRMLNNHPELKNTFNLEHQDNERQPRALAAAVLAYAEHIENPSLLAKALEHITTKHVSLDIQPEQYAIVGENLLHSISEVLDVAMDSDLIAAWQAAYMQLADLMISMEKNKYQTLASQHGGWTGWRAFKISAIEKSGSAYLFSVTAQDGQAILNAQANTPISVRVSVPEQELLQPQQFKLSASTENSYQFLVECVAEPSPYSVAAILAQHYDVGDVVELSAPMTV